MGVFDFLACAEGSNLCILYILYPLSAHQISHKVTNRFWWKFADLWGWKM